VISLLEKNVEASHLFFCSIYSGLLLMYEATEILCFLLMASRVIQKACRMFAEKSRHALQLKTEKTGELIGQWEPPEMHTLRRT
jgi:hypothetical protein